MPAVAIFGAFMGLYLRHYDLDIYAQIGLVMLIGLAANPVGSVIGLVVPSP